MILVSGSSDVYHGDFKYSKRKDGCDVIGVSHGVFFVSQTMQVDSSVVSKYIIYNVDTGHCCSASMEIGLQD